MFASKSTQEAVDNMDNEGARTVHDLKKDAKEGGRHLRNDLNNAASHVREAASHLKHDVEDAARQTGRQARELADAATGTVSEFSQSVTAKIRDNPVQSSVIALFVGIVFGMLSRRR